MINRTTKYFYDENEKLARMESYETYEKGDLGEDGEEGVLLENAVEIPGEGISPLGMIAVVLSAIGLGVSIGKLLQDK